LPLPGGGNDGGEYVLMGALSAVQRVQGETTTTIPALLRALFRLDPASPV